MGGSQGRHDVVAPHVLRAGGDCAQQPESGPHQGRAAQEDMSRCVRLLSAYWAEVCAAMRVLALRAAPGGALPDPVPPLGGAGPVASSQLVNVHRGCSISPGDGRQEARTHQLTVPPGRPGLDGTGSGQPGRRPVRGLDVDGRVGLVQSTGLLRDGVCPLVSSDTAV